MPYREGPALLLCTRCGEVLDRVFGGVSACPRCQGAWITQGMLDTAFGNARWPPGQNVWWHQELECPECASEGVAAKMQARTSEEVMVDLCPSHGLWLDHGELGRLMKLDEGTDELLALQQRVSANAPDPDELAQRRVAWRSELDARRRAAQEFRSWVEAEHKRKQAEAVEAEKQAAIRRVEERRQAREKERADEAARLARSRQNAAKLRELAERRVGVAHDVRALEARVAALKQVVERAEGELAEATSRLREIDDELDGGDLK